MRRIAYIPARGGSKGVPRKNIALINGLPMIAYAIRAAQEAKIFDRVFVSTDSEEIAQVAREYGAWVPFLRYAEFAQDRSRTIDAVCSDKCRLGDMGETFGSLCLLQVTSPLRTAADIVGAMAMFDRVGEGVMSISPVGEHPILMRTIGADGKVKKILECPSTVRRQDMPPVYKVNGAIYIVRWEDITPELSFNDCAYGYVMDGARSIDVDSPTELSAVRQVMERRS